MIEGYEPLTQAILGTLFTWGMTAAGAALVIFFRGTQVILNPSYIQLLKNFWGQNYLYPSSVKCYIFKNLVFLVQYRFTLKK